MRLRACSESWRALERAPEASAILADPPWTAFTLLYGGGTYEILAEDPLCRVLPEELPGLRFERRGVTPPFTPDLIGHVCYEAGYGLDPLLPDAPKGGEVIPDVSFSVFRRVVIREMATGRAWEAERQMMRELEPQPHALGKGRFRAHKESDSECPESYAAKVQAIREKIRQGRVYQVNLTRQEGWRVEGDLRVLAQRLLAANPAPYSALVADPAFTVISSSPERFLAWGRGRICTRPIKGTAPRFSAPEQDEASARELLASMKNRSELAMIVDLLRNDLTRFSGAPCTVEAFPLLESYANVFHLVADLSAPLPETFTLESLLRALFPGGSITGCPKLSAMQVIHDLEALPRRIYTGALGWMSADLRSGEWSIPIRTAWAVGGELRFGVGGGVVWDSEPRAEYEETVHKGRSLVQCLNS